MDLLKFLPELTQAQQAELKAQVEAIDYVLMDRLFDETKNFNALAAAEAKQVTPVESVRPNAVFEEKGKKLLQSNAVAAITMAGGQGTRLGHNGPKGTYDIGLESHRSLFELQCDSLKAVSGTTPIPWYIMTGEENRAATVKFFEEKNYFGYGKENVFFFNQGTLPILNTEGKPFLAEKHRLCSGPDGNGGIFKAALESGAYDDMEKRGVRYVFICGIDNAAVKMADPVLVGVAEMSKSEIVSKSVAKAFPEEKAGVFCYIGGRPGVIEYSELPDEYRYLTKENGELVYNDANIIAHVFPLNVLRRISQNGLPYHTAFKKMEYVDENGNKVVPEKENAYKYEMFIFDAFASCENMTVLRVERDEFAPVKNKTGNDSPETARAILARNGVK